MITKPPTLNGCDKKIFTTEAENCFEYNGQNVDYRITDVEFDRYTKQLKIAQNPDINKDTIIDLDTMGVHKDPVLDIVNLAEDKTIPDIEANFPINEVSEGSHIVILDNNTYIDKVYYYTFINNSWDIEHKELLSVGTEFYNLKDNCKYRIEKFLNSNIEDSSTSIKLFNISKVDLTIENINKFDGNPWARIYNTVGATRGKYIDIYNCRDLNNFPAGAGLLDQRDFEVFKRIENVCYIKILLGDNNEVLSGSGAYYPRNNIAFAEKQLSTLAYGESISCYMRIQNFNGRNLVVPCHVAAERKDTKLTVICTGVLSEEITINDFGNDVIRTTKCKHTIDIVYKLDGNASSSEHKTEIFTEDTPLLETSSPAIALTATPSTNPDTGEDLVTFTLDTELIPEEEQKKTIKNIYTKYKNNQNPPNLLVYVNKNISSVATYYDFNNYVFCIGIYTCSVVQETLPTPEPEPEPKLGPILGSALMSLNPDTNPPFGSQGPIEVGVIEHSFLDIICKIIPPADENGEVTIGDIGIDNLITKTYTRETLDEMLNAKISKEEGWGLISDADYIKLNNLPNPVIESFDFEPNLNDPLDTRLYTTINSIDLAPSEGAESYLTSQYEFPDVTDNYSGLMTPELKKKSDLLGEVISSVGLYRAPTENNDPETYLVVNTNTLSTDDTGQLITGSVTIPIDTVTNEYNGLMTPTHKSMLEDLNNETKGLRTFGTPSDTWILNYINGGHSITTTDTELLVKDKDNNFGNLHVKDLIVDGNVIQNGQTFITKAETVEIKDNIIELNKGEVGNGVTAGRAGILIDRGTNSKGNFVLFFDEYDDHLYAGFDNSSSLPIPMLAQIPSGDDTYFLMLTPGGIANIMEDDMIKTRLGIKDVDLSGYLPLTAGSSKPLTGHLHLHMDRSDILGPTIVFKDSHVNKEIRLSLIDGHFDIYDDLTKNTPIITLDTNTDSIYLKGSIYLGSKILERNPTSFNLEIGDVGTTTVIYSKDSIYHGESRVWDEANDGPDSGLDADTLDGFEATDFIRGINTNYNDTNINLIPNCTGAAPTGSHLLVATGTNSFEWKPISEIIPSTPGGANGDTYQLRYIPDSNAFPLQIQKIFWDSFVSHITENMGDPYNIVLYYEDMNYKKHVYRPTFIYYDDIVNPTNIIFHIIVPYQNSFVLVNFHSEDGGTSWSNQIVSGTAVQMVENFPESVMNVPNGTIYIKNV